MAFNIFKRKKDEPKKEEKEGKKVSSKSSAEQELAVKEDASEEQKQTQEAVSLRKKTISVAPGVLVRPNVTEKATILVGENKYVFRVFSNVTKGQVKDSVEEVYGVDVEAVRIINIPPKKVRLGKRREGVKKGYKKAVVKIKEGQKIEILPR